MPEPSASPTRRPPAARPRLTVVVVNYNGWDDVERLVSLLAPVPEVAAGLCDLVVIDNASQGPIPPGLRGSRPGVRVIVREENGGFAAGVNAGWRATEGRWLLILNPDVVPAPDLLARVLDRIDDGPDPPGIVGFALRNPDGTRQPSVGPFPGLLRCLCEPLIPRSRRKYQAGWRTKAGPVAWVTGACMLVDARMLDRLGGMDEDFFLYYEEVALCRSARRIGRRVVYDDRVEVIHLNPLQNRRVTPRLRVITRHSKLLYFRKHLPGRDFAGLALLVGWEARLRGLVARVSGRGEEERAWRVIGRMADAMRRGVDLRGPAVRDLAGACSRPDFDVDSWTSLPAAPRPSGGRRRPGAPPAQGPRSRKDGTECPPHSTRSASSR